MTPLAVGVDVGARRGCDVVVLGDDRIARSAGRVRTADELRALLAPLTPGVVAIDAPPAWAPPGRRRAGERALSAAGVSVFTTPHAARGDANPFYDWMRAGFTMFAGAAPTPALETFPHAAALALHGRRPERGMLRRPAEKLAWRRAALDAAGIDHSALPTIDEVDAALCAFTGRRWLEGAAVVMGDPADEAITLPAPLPPPIRRRGTP